MNKDTQRLILASVLIFLVVILTKPIFEALGYSMDSQPEEVQVPREKEQDESFNDDFNDAQNISESINNDSSSSIIIDTTNSKIENIEITIKTNLYTAIISNVSGGTLIGAELNKYNKDETSLVELKPFDSQNHCSPCLKDNNGPITEFQYSAQE